MAHPSEASNRLDVRASNISFSFGRPQDPLSKTSDAHGSFLPAAVQQRTLARRTMTMSRSMGNIATYSLASSMPGRPITGGEPFVSSPSPQECGELRQTLRSSKVLMGTNKRERHGTYGRSFTGFSRQQVSDGQGSMDAGQKADLQKVHFSLGVDSPKTLHYDWYETEAMRCAKSHWDPDRAWDTKGKKWGAA